MGKEKDIKVITGLFCVTLLLIGMAFFTITTTFAYNNSTVNEALTWNVYYGNAVIGNNKDGKVTVSRDNLDFSIKLDEFGEEFSFTTSAINDGDIDAVLKRVEKTNLDKLFVGTSKTTGETYYVSDYVSFNVDYVANNEKNGIRKDTKVKVGDKLYNGTNNKIIVTVKYRDKNKLSDDQLSVLKNYGYTFNLDLSVSTLYQQK